MRRVKRDRILLGWLWLGLALAGWAAMPEDDPAARVVVVVNSRQPESAELAQFYVKVRGIPAANIVALPLPEEETITWRQFLDEVFGPLQDELYRRGWLEGVAGSRRDRLGRRRYAFTGQNISFLVTCRGVPLRIANAPELLTSPARFGGPFNKNEAAVDSELTLLAGESYDPAGPMANPCFAQRGPATLDALQVVKVCRLDGPTWTDARHLVTAALEAERTGLRGRYYVDLHGPHPEGDVWLRETATELRTLGFDGDVEDTPATFAASARFDRPIFYFGWYAADVNGPFLNPGFRFPPGAIALHIHSYSAQTMRSDSVGWCGPLIARGVTATLGNVYEPDLKFTHRPDLLVEALARGDNFGDAAYYALPALSWQAIAIGDPLYRPWARKENRP